LKEKTPLCFISVPGEGSLIGASASCSSYQQPRRGRGRERLKGFASTSKEATQAFNELICIDAFFTDTIDNI
jgi:hypothetical protein